MKAYQGDIVAGEVNVLNILSRINNNSVAICSREKCSIDGAEWVPADVTAGGLRLIHFVRGGTGKIGRHSSSQEQNSGSSA
jgi:hypothetical protein